MCEKKTRETVIANADYILFRVSLMDRAGPNRPTHRTGTCWSLDFKSDGLD